VVYLVEIFSIQSAWYALPGKLDAWQEARQVDFSSRTQADPTVLLGGLDFEHLLR